MNFSNRTVGLELLPAALVVHMAGAGGALYRGLDTDGDGRIDESEELVGVHCSNPVNVGLGQAGTRILWADVCVATVHATEPEGGSLSVVIETEPSKVPVALSGPPDPCQR